MLRFSKVEGGGKSQDFTDVDILGDNPGRQRVFPFAKEQCGIGAFVDLPGAIEKTRRLLEIESAGLAPQFLTTKPTGWEGRV